MQFTVAEYIIAQLSAWGVKRIYGVSGSETIPLYDAISKNTDIELITVRHESAAGFMASTEAKYNGGLAVCITTSGPGLTNLMNGIADASQDHVPVLVLSGQIKSEKIGTHFKQYIDQQRLISPLALYTELITHANATPSLLLHAMQTSLLQKGVTHLSIPVDLQSSMLEDARIIAWPSSLFQSIPQIDKDQIQIVSQRIVQAKQPLILIGVGARNAVTSIIQLAEQIGAGIVASLGAKGMIPEQHQHHIGSLGDGGSDEAIELLQEADLLITIGCTWYPEPYVPKQLPIIHIDLNPSNIALEHSISEVLIGRAEEIIPSLISTILDRSDRQPSDWIHRVQSMHAQYIERIATETALETNLAKVHPAHLMGALAAQLPDNAVIVLDTGEHTIWFNRYFTGKCERVLLSGKWRSMGYALPAANAIQLMYPDKMVVAIIGDGSFLMNLGECATTKRYQLPIKVIVMNNNALILEERRSIEKGYQPIGTTLTNPDFVQLASAFGWHGINVSNENDLSGAIQQMLTATTPILLDVELNSDMPRDIKPSQLSNIPIDMKG